MSFSFNVRAATAALALSAVSLKLDEVVALQPIHANDRDEVEKTAYNFVAMLPVDDSRDVCVSVNGWISTVDGAMTGVSVGCSASLMARPVEA